MSEIAEEVAILILCVALVIFAAVKAAGSSGDMQVFWLAIAGLNVFNIARLVAMR